MIVALVSSVSLASVTAYAAFPNILPRYTCDEGIHPYIAGAPNTSDNTAIAHLLDADCKAHLDAPFPNQHHQQPDGSIDPATHNPLKTNVSVSYLHHYHAYFNDSNQDDGLHNYYRSGIRKFEITLQPDFMKNVDLTTLLCAVPSDGVHTPNMDFEDCNGQDNYTFGGTKVSRVNNIITYEFGIDHGWGTGNQTGKPIIPGRDPDIDQGVYFNGDTTISNLIVDQNGEPSAPPRGMLFGIDAKTKDGLTYTAWSGTTTSRVEILDQYIPQSTFSLGKDHNCVEGGDYAVGGAKQGWCTANTWHWFDIGTVVTDWKQPSIPPPPTVCLSLPIIHAWDNSHVDVYDAANHTIPAATDVTFELKAPTFSSTPIPLDYRWTAVGKGGLDPLNPVYNPLWGGFMDFLNAPGLPANPYTDTNNSPLVDDLQTYYTNTADNAGTHIVIQPVAYQTADLKACHDYVDVKAAPQKEIACKNIDLTPQAINGPDQNTSFHAVVHLINPDSPNSPIDRPTTVSWTNNTPTSGSYTTPTSDTHSSLNPFAASYQTTPASTTASISVAVTNVTPNAGETFDQSSLAKCSTSVKTGFPPPKTNVCTSLGLTKDGVPTSDPTITVGPNANTLLQATPVNTPPNAPPNAWPNPTFVVWTQTGDAQLKWGPVSTTKNAQNGGMFCPDPSMSPSFVAPIICDYYLKTPATGSGSVTITAQPNAESGNKDVSLCTATLNFNSQPQTPICSNLNPNYTGTTISAYPVKTDNSVINQVNWTESGDGYLELSMSTPPGFYDLCYEALGWSTIIDNTTKLTPRQCQFNYIKTTPGQGNVVVKAVPDDGVAACTQNYNYNNVTPPPPPGHCTGLNIIPNTQICVSPNGQTNGIYSWTVGNTIQNNTSYCQNVGAGQNWSVHATDYPECQTSGTVPPPPPPPYGYCTGINPSYDNSGRLCLYPTYSNNATPNGNDFSWNINGTSATGLCNYIQQGKPLTVNGPNPPACSLSEAPPLLTKTVSADGVTKGGSSNPLTLQPSGTPKEVTYTLTFTPNAQYTSATITDTMSTGSVRGVISNTTTNSSTFDNINYDDSMKVTQNGSQLPTCTATITTDCYHGDIGSSGGVTLEKLTSTSPVIITYNGKVNYTVLNTDCADQTSPYCQEKYPNTATANYQIFSPPSPIGPQIELSNGTLTSDALVQSFCQYILTRASGDIYLQTDLNFGKDISQCSPYKSSTGLIITPGNTQEQNLIKTGLGETVSIGHNICNTGLSTQLNGQSVQLFGQNAASQNLSSQICEVKLRPGQSWDPSNISSTIKENITRVSRWTPNLNNWGTSITSFDTLPKSNTGVYHLKDSNLTIGETGTVTLDDGQGAKTIIVENGDLHIMNNITYSGRCVKTDNSICTVRDTASLAFIVLNGNVIIDPGVTEVSGVIFVQKGDEGTGKILSGPTATDNQDSYKPITFYGSIYGDIQNLFEHRKYAGDPAANQGSVVIRFDERIILNTPPGLTDVLQLSESQVAQ